MNEQNIPGKSQATISLVCGIISLALIWFGYSAILSVILGIVGIVFAVKAKKQGFTGGLVTAGMVISIIGLVLGGIAFLACMACAGTLAATGCAAAATT